MQLCPLWAITCKLCVGGPITNALRPVAVPLLLGMIYILLLRPICISSYLRRCARSVRCISIIKAQHISNVTVLKHVLFALVHV